MLNKRPPRNGQNNELESHHNLLVVDGSSLFKRSFLGSKEEFNSKGEHVGGIYQFITVLRKIMLEDLYHKVFVLWDGEYSGKLRYDIYKDYKSGRGKNYEEGTAPTDESELYQRVRIQQYLEELFIRQLEHDFVEADDFIAYICNNKNVGDKITIITSDRDLCQLIDDDIKIYMCDLKKYITKENFRENFGYNLENALLIKILCGDGSDSIKGVKRLGEKTLYEYFPEITERKLTLEEVINKSKLLQDERISNKQKPLQILDNISYGITDGIQGDKLYEINNKIINLKNPLISEDAMDMIDNIINSPINPEGREIKNVYKFIKEDGLNNKIINNFEDYFLPFKKLINRELK